MGRYFRQVDDGESFMTVGRIKGPFLHETANHHGVRLVISKLDAPGKRIFPEMECRYNAMW